MPLMRMHGPNGQFTVRHPNTDIEYGLGYICAVKRGLREWVLPGGFRTTSRETALEAAKYIADQFLKHKLRSGNIPDILRKAG